ncbi:MAG: acylase [Flavobacteriaceae bacterium]|nr:acylase [Flavobacteriaceae bacterium]
MTYFQRLTQLFFFAAVLLLGSFGWSQSAPAYAEIQQWTAQAKQVEIIRDTYGVPHIYGKTDADVVFGLMYAQCEDDFNRVETNFLTAIGRLAEAQGTEGLYSDLRARLWMTDLEAQDQYNTAPAWLQELCQGWADGLNYYLYRHPEVKPRAINRFEPWMSLYFTEGSIGGDIERVSLKSLAAFYENAPEPLAVHQPKARDIQEPAGSNGIALSGDKTSSGYPMLLINPHTSFYFRGEAHMVSETGLNAYGAITWGQFFIYQGFNEQMGWMHTSTYVDVMDEYIEEIVPTEQGLTYRYGHEWRPVIVDTVSIRVKQADGSLKTLDFPRYKTHHGPITHTLDGRWTATSMMWRPVDALAQSYLRTKQENYEDFVAVMQARTNASNNTVYADQSGNIAYFHGNFVPKRNPAFDFSAPQKGSDPQTDWQGLHPIEELIFLKNPSVGWVQNCNSTPYTAAAEDSPRPEDYAPYMATADENFRAIHAQQLLAQADKLDLDGLIQLGYDPYLPAMAALIPGLVQSLEALKETDPRFAEAASILGAWDFTTSAASVPMTLGHYYGTAVLRKGVNPLADSSQMDFLSYFGTQSPAQERVDLMKGVLDQLTQDFGDWRMPWGQVNRYQRLDGGIRQAFDDDAPSLAIGHASGIWGALAAYGARYFNNTKKIYGTRGNSFVAVVEFGPKVKAKSLLAGGQSSDPNSPHFRDQEEMYAQGKFKEVPFYREAVEASAQRKYHPGF